MTAPFGICAPAAFASSASQVVGYICWITARPWSPVKLNMRLICSNEMRWISATNMATLDSNSATSRVALTSGMLTEGLRSTHAIAAKA